jgi:hypothetical protein
MRKGRTETGEREENVLVSWKRILSEYFLSLRGEAEAISWNYSKLSFQIKSVQISEMMAEVVA